LLGLFTPELGIHSVAAVREGLHDLGWHEGQNIRFESRYASGKRDQLGALAAELVGQKVDIIVAFGTDATRAARGATSSIPIVMGAVSDPGVRPCTGPSRPEPFSRDTCEGRSLRGGYTVRGNYKLDAAKLEQVIKRGGHNACHLKDH
jgi:hypothetical protein